MSDKRSSLKKKNTLNGLTENTLFRSPKVTEQRTLRRTEAMKGEKLINSSRVEYYPKSGRTSNMKNSNQSLETDRPINNNKKLGGQVN